MCIGGSAPKIAAPIIAAPDNGSAGRDAALQRQIQRQRAGAAANILTSPTGIPASRGNNAQLGAA